MSKSGEFSKVLVIKVKSEDEEPQWVPSLGEDASGGRLFGREKREDVADNGVRQNADSVDSWIRMLGRHFRRF